MMEKRDRLFGMALGRMELPPGDIPDFFTFSHFSAVELPVEHWTKPADGGRRSLRLGSFRSGVSGRSNAHAVLALMTGTPCQSLSRTKPAPV